MWNYSLRSEFRLTAVYLALAIGFSLIGIPGTSFKTQTVVAFHDHNVKAPHGGVWLELGDEEYHAELLVEAKTNAVTVYLFDREAKSSVAIPAKDVVIKLMHDGEFETFKLKPHSQKADPPKLSSRFVLKDAELVTDLSERKAEGELIVKIRDKTYTVKIDHAARRP